MLLEKLNSAVVYENAIQISIILAIGWLFSFMLKKAISNLSNLWKHRAEKSDESINEATKRIDTITRLLKQGSFIAVWLTVTLVILRELGVEIGPILASAGILGLAIGFGAQNLVRDFISGFFMILENQIRVGDVAIINGTGGLVESINLRTTILRDLKGVVHFFQNGKIDTLSNMTSKWSAYVFDVGVAYKENTDNVIEKINEVIDSMVNDEEFADLIIEEPEIFGVDQLADSSVIIKGRIKTKPIMQWAVGREFLRRIKLTFDNADIEIPFPHSTIYFGEASQPFDVTLMNSESNINIENKSNN